MGKPKNFIVVDDDRTNNLICEYTIKKFNNTAEIKAFTDPREALQFIAKEQNYDGNATILFLDINMPIMSGFEFIEEFRILRKDVTERYHIYMLSSSIKDFSSRAENFPMVKTFLSKPLKLSHLQDINRELKSNS